MPISDELVKRLQKELRKKLEIVTSSPGRPSEKTIQERIKFFGDRCHEWTATVRHARYEYVGLTQDRKFLLNQRGGALHFSVKLLQLHDKHLQQQKDLLAAVELFILAHDWYEVLVVAGKVDELSRLAFLQSIGGETAYEPLEPGDPNYPQPTAVIRTYQRRDILTMARSQKTLFDTILKEEKEAVDKAMAESESQCTFEETVMRQIQHDLDELKDEVWRQAEVLKERMETLERFQSNTTLRILESINQKHSATLPKIEEVAESRSTSREEISYSYNDHFGRRYEEKREERAQRNQSSMSKHQLEELLHE
ncbi:hypothetical protein Y032_0458g1824 [Ancylostoma ceylanicum]|uniref:Uncharacterized protein n=1 Tax=Ancylostoma ceylanicum TaxID=53326 RepID=A0A016WYA6_9BILA|nr:hypothetical protein Y032_0458g1824 [Ancylostoma ceylanicum]